MLELLARVGRRGGGSFSSLTTLKHLATSWKRNGKHKSQSGQSANGSKIVGKSLTWCHVYNSTSNWQENERGRFECTDFDILGLKNWGKSPRPSVLRREILASTLDVNFENESPLPQISSQEVDGRCCLTFNKLKNAQIWRFRNPSSYRETVNYSTVNPVSWTKSSSMTIGTLLFSRVKQYAEYMIWFSTTSISDFD